MATRQPTINESLLGYIEQHNLPLISKMILGNRVSNMVDVRTGIKGKFTLTEIDADPVIQCGHECGWTEDGTTTFTPVEICAAPYKINMAFCDKKLLDTWMNYEVKVAAGIKTLPFEEYWTDQIVNKVNAQLEKSLFISKADDCACSQQGGVYNIAVNHGVTVNTDEISDKYGDNFTVLDIIRELYNRLPDYAKNDPDLVAFMSYNRFNQLKQALITTSGWHVIPDGATEEIIIPGTMIKAIPTIGLEDPNNAGEILLTNPKNIVLATDLRDDQEKFDLWYSKDNREFRLAIEFIFGSGLKDPAAAAAYVEV